MGSHRDRYRVVCIAEGEVYYADDPPEALTLEEAEAGYGLGDFGRALWIPALIVEGR